MKETLLLGIFILCLFVLIALTGNILSDASAHPGASESSSLVSIWHVLTVDMGVSFGGSLALDSLDRPHIGYTNQNGNLLHSYYDGSNWHTGTVEQGGVRTDTSLALDSIDGPHIGYIVPMRDLDQLRYAYYDGANWSIQSLDDAVIFGHSLVLDDLDHPHLAYYDYITGALKYAHHDGTSWLFEAVEVLGQENGGPSLALDSSGHPHIGCFDSPHQALLYAYYDGTTWFTETVGSNLAVWGSMSLSLDSLDRPHIAYCLQSCDEWGGCWCDTLQYTHYDGSSWQTEWVDLGGRSVSLRLDHSDFPHISYVDTYSRRVKYAHYNGSTWVIESVDSLAPSVGSSLAIDSQGLPSIVYSDYTDGILKYAYRREWAYGLFLPLVVLDSR